MNTALQAALTAVLVALTETLKLVNSSLVVPSATPAKAVAAPAAVATPSEADLLGGEPTAAVAAPAAKPAKVAKPAAVAAPAMTGSVEAAIAAIPATMTGLVRAREIARIKREFAKSNPTPAAAVATPAAVEPAAAVAAPAPAAAPAKVAAPKKAAAPKAAPAAAPAAVEGAVTALTVRELGIKLLKKDPKNGSKTLQGILAELGAANLSTLAPDKLQAATDKLTALLA